jgi:hypothetical protein
MTMSAFPSLCSFSLIVNAHLDMGQGDLQNLETVAHLLTSAYCVGYQWAMTQGLCADLHGFVPYIWHWS